jgi:hypothetical protein
MDREFAECAAADDISVLRESSPDDTRRAAPNEPTRPGDIITIGVSFI